MNWMGRWAESELDDLIEEILQLRNPNRHLRREFISKDKKLIEFVRFLRSISAIEWPVFKKKFREVAKEITKEHGDPLGCYDKVSGKILLSLTCIRTTFGLTCEEGVALMGGAVIVSRRGGMDALQILRENEICDDVDAGRLIVYPVTKGEIVGTYLAKEYGLPQNADGTVDKLGSVVKIAKGLFGW